MKRFAWLAILAFCTALAQVQPVAMPAAQDQGCCCCDDQAGACGMPDCAPAPASAQPLAGLQAVASVRTEARKLSPATRVTRESFYVQFESRRALTPTWRTSLPGVPPASVPLFKSHCSFLI